MRAVISAVLLTVTVAHAQPAPAGGDRPMDPVAPLPPDLQPLDPTAPPSEPAPTSEPPTAAPPPVEPAPAPPAAPVVEPAPAPAPLPAAPPSVTPSRNKDFAWLFVGSALTFATAGAVLGYSTSSAEADIKDLYVTTGMTPPRFDANTRRQYEDLVDEGNRYQLLSIVSFSIAGACAVGATIFFARASHEDAPAIVPVITPTSAGVSLRF